LLAQMLQWSFVDTDSEMVAQLGMSITDFVDENGWQAFRNREKAIMIDICKRNMHVVATGGGVAMDVQNVRCMRKNGVIIWLKALPKTITDRLLADEKTQTYRPALTAKGLVEEIEETLLIRNPHYENAMHCSIQTDQLSIHEICNIAVKRLPKEVLQ